MIGNDVVDLSLASTESNWRRPGFLKKVFTLREQSCILNSDNPDLTVWLLWSMKESAYKTHVQRHREFFFAPLRFECRLVNGWHNNYEGDVCFNNSRYKTTSEYFNRSIFTLAFAEDYSPENNVIYTKLAYSNTCYNAQHKEIYLSVLRKISGLKGKPLELFSIKKDSCGVPEIFSDGQRLNMSLSLSHHGRYGAHVLVEHSCT